MTNKYQLINEIANDTLKEITRSSENWIKFLNTASNNYKYSFSEQVLIYAQKPEATACAEIEIWNKRLKRWVNKGAKGIALISIENGRNTIRHVFDISDTHSGINKELRLWEVKPSYENGLIETLENSFGNLEMKKNLSEAIYSCSSNLVEDNYNDYLKELKEVIDNSSLQELEDVEIDGIFISLLINSVTYMVMKRCGLDPTEIFNLETFSQISSFNTKQVISRLGAAISDIAEQELREIYSSVRNFEKSRNNINYTFVNNQKTNYHVVESKNEGRNDYARVNIQTNGRLSNTTSSITTNKENDTREILKNEGEIPKGTQKRTIRGIDARWQDGRTFRRNRGNSSKQIETTNQTISRESTSERRNEESRSNALGTSNELNTKSSRGNDNNRVDLQLNLFTDSYIPPIKSLPSVEEQINNIQAQAEVENTSAFEFTQKVIDDVLLEGSHFADGKFRIYRLFQEGYSTEDNITFLKKEYGEGGGGVRNYENLDEWHNAKGIRLTFGLKENAPETLLTWSKVEKRIKELVNADIYLNINEKEEYQKWLNEEYENQKWMYDARINPDQKQVAIDEENQDIQNIEKNYKLSNGDYFHFHTNDEGYYYAIYNNFGTEIDGGLLEYSEIDNTKQSELDIRKRLAEFTDIEELANENLREVSQEFIDALESGAIAEEVGNAVLERVENDTINAIDELKAIEQAQKINALFKAREENGKPLNRDEYYKNQEKINYHIDNNSLGEGTPKEKVRRNIDAIKLLKKLEDENRLANKDEQEILAQYIGWGGLPDVFDENKSNWSEEYHELKELLTDDEYKSARASTLTAFYTPPIVINAIYKTLQNKYGKGSGIVSVPTVLETIKFMTEANDEYIMEVYQVMIMPNTPYHKFITEKQGGGVVL